MLILILYLRKASLYPNVLNSSNVLWRGDVVIFTHSTPETVLRRDHYLHVWVSQKGGGVTTLFHGGINFLLNVLILQWLGRVKRLTKKIATVERLQINFKTSKICSIIFNLFLPIKYTEGGGVKIYLDNYYNTVIWMHPYLCNTYVWCLSVL